MSGASAKGLVAARPARLAFRLRLGAALALALLGPALAAEPAPLAREARAPRFGTVPLAAPRSEVALAIARRPQVPAPAPQNEPAPASARRPQSPLPAPQNEPAPATARRPQAPAPAPHPEAVSPAAPSPPPAPAAPPRQEADRLAERAHQDREIVYFLQAPETHSFRLYHDYTESRPGVDRYLNVVRAGSTVADPQARNLDSGEPLPVAIVRGSEVLAAAGGEPIPPEAEVVIVRFPQVTAGGSIRLRITETYTDPGSYRLEGGELTFDRSFGRPRNAVVLPAGWYLTASAIPALVSETPDGRIRLDFVNPRPDEIAVLIKARLRP